MAEGGEEVTDEYGFRHQRRRNMTEKGLEYNLELKQKSIKKKDTEICRKLNNIDLFSDLDEIKREISILATELDTVIEGYDEIILLLSNPVEIDNVEERKTVLRNLWHSVNATVQNCLLKHSDTKSVTSRHSSRNSRLSKSSSTTLSQTLVEFEARRAALEEKIKYEAAIAEQEKKLKELRLQQELEELKAKAAVYERVLEDEEELEEFRKLPKLSSERQYVIFTFLQCDENKTPVKNAKTKQNTVAKPGSPQLTTGTPQPEEFQSTTGIPQPEKFQFTTGIPTEEFKFPAMGILQPVKDISQFQYSTYKREPHIHERHRYPATSKGHPSASQFQYSTYNRELHVHERHRYPATSKGHPSANQFKYSTYNK